MFYNAKDTLDKFVTNLFISKLVFTKSEGQVTF